MDRKPRIAHLAGPNATIQNTPSLVTSNKARAKHNRPLLTGSDGTPARFDVLISAGNDFQQPRGNQEMRHFQMSSISTSAGEQPALGVAGRSRPWGFRAGCSST